MRLSAFFITLLLAAPAFAATELPTKSTNAAKIPDTSKMAAVAVQPDMAPMDAGVEPAKLSAADKAQITRIETYLGTIKTISAHFSQVSSDGNISGGKFYLQRPGKLRMEYEPPVPVLVVTSSGNIVYYDKELDQVTNIPLSSTLVGFLARNTIRFDKSITITGFESGQKSFRISLVQAENPKDGTLTLELSDQPLLLRNIIMTDSGGQSTTVSLANARFGDALDPTLFVFKDPHPKGNRSIRK